MTGGHASPPPLTVARRIVRGEILRRGRAGSYHALAEVGGEPHIVRDDLLPGVAQRWRADGVRLRPLLCVAHVTDLQLADVQSPVRFEFLNRRYDDPRFAELVPVQRPQEAFTPHAVLATIETLNRITSGPVGGAPPALAVTTGDAIDNAQWNELQAVLALFDGGDVRVRSGGDRYQGVQSRSWPDRVFWRPDGLGPDGRPDLFRDRLAFPHLPGALERALDGFRSPGLTLPWLACYGNHEALVQGVGMITPEVAAALVGGRKPTDLPADLDLDRALDTFISGCQAFLGGADRSIDPDPDRRPLSRREFVDAHRRVAPQGEALPGPAGHGFTAENARLGTAYYVHDQPGVRFIGLDTTRAEGGAAGALDVDQLWWLQARLAEVHSRYRAPDGTTMVTGERDRLVVLFSHHGADTLTNILDHPRDGVAPDLVGGQELVETLHRFPNVVLWLSGHTHTNRVRPRIDPHDPRRGFWEVTTCAIVDWPCQTRLVELLDLGNGILAIACTMVDHDSPLGPGASLEGSALTSRQLASLHRELAGNVPYAGAGTRLEGIATDRNVVLPLRAPFDLGRVPSAG
ncbi:MAG TPA: TIGR03767 family metallophosphoesterase [Kineosporiaceae bacterium]